MNAELSRLPLADRRRPSAAPGGFTLIEMVIVLVIAGILLTVAMRAGVTISQSGKVEETKKGMQDIEFAVCGNPTLENNGVRSDFGYVGDVGSLPPNLDALYSNPGSYGTWNGPYVKRRFQQDVTGFEQDAWGVNYQYSGGVGVTSTGSGSNIVRSFANSTADLLYNKVSGTITDRDGLPPGPTYKDSLSVRLTVPNGAGSLVTMSKHPDPSGYFLFDSIPIGNHDLQGIYTPTNDTLNAYVTVTPASTSFNPYRFSYSIWGTSAIGAVNGSDSVYGSPPCTDVSFWIVNNSGKSKTISSVTVSWGSPTSYYAQIYWGATQVFNLGGSPRGVSGTNYAFSAPQTIASGQKVRIQVLDFRANNTSGGGSPAAMSTSTITFVFSDGSSFTEVFPTCP